MRRPDGEWSPVGVWESQWPRSRLCVRRRSAEEACKAVLERINNEMDLFYGGDGTYVWAKGLGGWEVVAPAKLTPFASLPELELKISALEAGG